MRGAVMMPKMAPVLYDTVYMRGGWDTQTPTLELYPGAVRDVQNFEVTPNPAGGYARIAGYERYDGRPSPTDATFGLVQLASFTNVPTVGQTLAGFTSGATGVIIALTSTYIIVTKITGAFLDTEVVKVGGTTIGTAVPNTTTLSSLLTAQYTQLAADNYRADITTVPGTGPVRGVVSAAFGGVDIVYAFRDTGGNCLLYKSSGSGWVNVPYYNEVSFSNAASVIADGLTLTQGGVTATIKRVVLQTGSWTSGVNTGRFIITNPSGGNFAGGAATVGAIAVTLGGIQTAITMTTGGKFQFVVDNLSGQSTTRRIYGCDNVNRGFEFDGDTLVPIVTGANPDAPTNVAIHALQLFFSFGSSVIHSGPGTPYVWTAVGGSSELACGDTVVSLLVQPGGVSNATLAIITFTDTKMLYGTGVANWNLVSTRRGIGGIQYSGQILNVAYWMNGAGVFDLRTTLEYGNFKQASVTNMIQDYIVAQRAKVAYSALNRTKNQYRVLFTDSNALLATIVNGKLIGVMKAVYAHSMNCAWSSSTLQQEERVFYGATTTGYVYRVDRGSSFDGSVIDAYIVFNWNSQKTPRLHKRYRRAAVEMQGNFYANFSFGFALGYNTIEIIQPPAVSYDSGFVGLPLWDSAIWDAFSWDGVTLKPADVQMTGTAENVQVTIRSGTNYIQPFTINSLIIHYSLRRGVRS